MLMALPLNSQITLKKGEIKAYLNQDGDTILVMNIDDAKLILTDILNYKIADSIINVYSLKSDEQSKVIELQKQVISKLIEKSENKDEQLRLLESIIKNKDVEIGLLNDVIKQQKSEIRRQKFMKFAGISAAVILPIIILLIAN
jgi:myosin heavy subunit